MIDRIVLHPLGDDPPQARLLYGQDVRASLKLIPDQSVHTVCTSPPYWGLRDYGGEPTIWDGVEGCDHQWGDEITVRGQSGDTAASTLANASGRATQKHSQTEPTSSVFCTACGAWRGQLGLEPSPELFVQHLVEVFREVKRVLRDDGTLWMNLGDSYTSGGRSGHGTRVGHKQQTNRGMCGVGDPVRLPQPENLKPKDLVGIPWMVAFALRADGWYLRSDIIWAKGNCMPESIRDRPTKAHEYIFLLTKSERYFYDADAIREPSSSYSLDVRAKGAAEGHPQPEGANFSKQARHSEGGHTPKTKEERAALLNVSGRNKRTVWNVNPKPYPGSHFAVWPETLVEPMIQAGSSEHGCCSKCRAPYKRADAGWSATCSCDGGVIQPCLVLDPFSGSATTGAVAMRLGRNYIGCDLQSDYLDLAVARLENRRPPAQADDDTDEDNVLDLFE